VSEDLGVNWKLLTANLNQNAANVILEDSENENILYLGTDTGLYISLDKGINWQDFSIGIPSVAVHDLVIQKREKDLIVATHGRSLYKVNVANIQQINEKTIANGVALFPIKNIPFSKNWGNKRFAWGTENTPNVSIWYYIKELSNTGLTIKNKDGIVVFNRPAKSEKGMLKVDFDLSIDEKTKMAIEKKDGKIKINQSGNKKYYLPAGKYTIELENNGKKEAQFLEIIEKNQMR
jgi:ligand-binding sensor domain-containing protein